MTKNRKVILISLILLTALVSQTAEAKVVAKKKIIHKPYHYTRIFYYQNGQRARASFLAHLGSIDVLAPQTYSVDGNGTLTGKIDAELLAVAQKHKIKIMPLVTNDGFDRTVTETFLDNPTAQDAAVAALVNEAVAKKYWGWQVDFEQMDVAYRDKFSAFVKKFSDALKEKNLIASVAVIAQISENPDDYPKNSWQYVVGVYDYAALATNTDFLSMMSYDDPGSKGPAARYSWDEQVIKYALQFMPPEKLSLGIPFYYWQWNETTGKRIGVGGYAGIQNTLKKHRVIYGYGEEEQAPYIRYTSKKRHYIIWYENAMSVKKKLGLIKQYRLHGFSAWALGLEMPSVYRAIKPSL